MASRVSAVAARGLVFDVAQVIVQLVDRMDECGVDREPRDAEAITVLSNIRQVMARPVKS